MLKPFNIVARETLNPAISMQERSLPKNTENGAKHPELGIYLAFRIYL